MIGGAPFLGLNNNLQLNKKFHEEHAKAMAATGQTTPRPYPTYYTNVEGGEWHSFDRTNSIKFSDGSIYDTRTKSWRPAKVDVVDEWQDGRRKEPFASNWMLTIGNKMVDEILTLRAKLLDLEMEHRAAHDPRALAQSKHVHFDDEGDF